MNHSDRDICEKLNFESLYRKYAKEVRNFMFFKTQSIDKAEDFMQEAFLKLWENCSNVNIDKVKSYLFSTANNMFLNQVKHQKVVRNYEKHYPGKDDVETPEFIAIEKEFLDKINRVIASLPEKQREVFIMSRIEKKKYKDIANILDISEKAVEKRMQRALVTIREKIGDV